jgi:hypothetical protein
MVEGSAAGGQRGAIVHARPANVTNPALLAPIRSVTMTPASAKL